MSGRDLECQIADDRILAVEAVLLRVFKTDLIEANIPVDLIFWQCYLAVFDGLIGVQEVEDPVGGSHRALVHIQGFAKRG